jgi:protein-L-isoaspartate(D-aspartate) O-methyltransferase
MRRVLCIVLLVISLSCVGEVSRAPSLSLSEGNAVSTSDSVVVVANSIDKALSVDLFNFLENRGIHPIKISAIEFEKYKKEKFIVILGGPDAYEGVGDIVREILDSEEEEYIRIPGKKRMYVKSDVWVDGQRICIIAGSGREQTKTAGIENQIRLYQNYLDLSEDPYLTKKRREMVEKQLRQRDIIDKKVLEVMGRVPRHKFVKPEDINVAYEDHPLPIGEGQTISQPYVVALMTQALELKGDEKVLEIGTGSGYQAAILAEIVEEVYTIEIREGLAKNAEERLRGLGYNNVHVKNADGYFGWEEHAPFDAIMITAAVNHIPPPLVQQLKEGGRLILPLGPTTYYQTMTIVEKKDGEIFTRNLPGFYRFVPMVGEAQKG